MKTVNNIFKHTFFCLALGTTVCSCDLDVEPTSGHQKKMHGII